MTSQNSRREPLTSVPVMEDAEVEEEEEDTLLRTRRHKSIRKVREWQQKDCDNGDKVVVMIAADQPQPKLRPVFRGRTPSYEALRCAVTELHRIDDFDSERLGEGFFSEVFKVTHKTTGRVMVLKKNKYRSNSLNSLKEIQLMNKLRHPNILKFEAVCVHEGQLHALTEFIDGGTLEEFILDTSTNIAWSDRIRIGGEIAQGLSYLNSRGMFHRDLTSKNIFMKKSYDKKLLAIIGDFGLATRIPARSEPRLAQVGSPYWMSPECLRGEFYDQSADIFSFGIIMCELIARVEADPDILPRTNNFGVEYKAFSELCPACPADFLKLTFTCVSIDPESRPSPGELVNTLGELLVTQAELERREVEARKTSVAAFKMGLSDSKLCDKTNSRRTPSEKARLHSKTSINSSSSVLERSESNAKEIGEEMCRLDPHYSPTEAPQNPFTTLPRMREGRKIIGSHAELFSSCAEIPMTESNHEWFRRKSLPYHLKQYSPSFGTKSESSQSNSSETIETSTPTTQTNAEIKRGSSETIQLLPIQQRVRKLFSKTQSQDDSMISQTVSAPLRRWGSCESGIFSAATEDWIAENGIMSNKSTGSSLLTVSDLEVSFIISVNICCNHFFPGGSQSCFGIIIQEENKLLVERQLGGYLRSSR